MSLLADIYGVDDAKLSECVVHIGLVKTKICRAGDWTDGFNVL